jgi:membrane-bound ClpP family serine protease
MEDEYGHGHSIASWTGVGLLLVASALIALGVYLGLGWAVWSGVALVVVGVGAWIGLEAAGYGVTSSERKH